MTTAFYHITTKIKEHLKSSAFVNTVTEGNIFDVDLNKKTIYPLSHIMVNNCQMIGNVLQFNISVIAMDIIDYSNGGVIDIFVGNDNTHDVLNTQLVVLLELEGAMLRGELWDDRIELIGDPINEPFTDRFEDNVAGWTATFDVQIPNEISIC